jgi:hypothetical protein
VSLHIDVYAQSLLGPVLGRWRQRRDVVGIASGVRIPDFRQTTKGPLRAFSETRLDGYASVGDDEIGCAWLWLAGDIDLAPFWGTWWQGRPNFVVSGSLIPSAWPCNVGFVSATDPRRNRSDSTRNCAWLLSSA